MPGGIQLIHAIAATIAASIPVGIIGAKNVQDNRDRSRRNQRMLIGDPKDPNVDGVLQLAKDIDEKVDDLDDNVREVRQEARQNREIILRKLEDMNGDDGTDDFSIPPEEH